MKRTTSEEPNFEEADAFEEDYEPQSHIYHKLMQFKVKRILLVSSLYDAFVIEEEGLIPELVIGEYSHLDLSSPPHVFRVSSGTKALETIKNTEFDLVITMSKNIGMEPDAFGEQIKKIDPNVPVVLLATDMADLYDAEERKRSSGIDKVFYWNGDSNLFIAIIKYIEDLHNVRDDMEHGEVQVIVVVEDSIRHYSMFLPIIYSELVRQTQKLISEDLNDMQRRLRMRVRPKVLMAETYEEGISLFNLYRDHVLGVISDVNFTRNGNMDPDAGYSLLNTIRHQDRHVPILLQSTKEENRMRVETLGAYFLHKNSPLLLQDFRHFLLDHLGFGDFIFLLPKLDDKGEIIEAEAFEGGKDWLHESTIELGRASDLKEFEDRIKEVPPASLRFHGDRRNFSNWLMARGEFKLARKLRPRKDSEFEGPDEVRTYLIGVFREHRKEKQFGIITDFHRQNFEFDSSFSRLGGGSLGGKGRGIAFIRSILTRYNLQGKYPSVELKLPNTVVIGTEEFDQFIKQNDLRSIGDLNEISDREIAEIFLKGTIPQELEKDLLRLVDHFRTPLAVRSSSLLEDSQNYPFAGIYATYMLPNNHEDDGVRFRHLCDAVKLVYASMFFANARQYIESTASKVEEEKMAVVIQEVVGRQFDDRFYPNFSGVGQSYNFYPFSHQTYEDGVVSLAVGLGKAIVGGEKIIRFSPKFPTLIPEFSTSTAILDNSQRELYVIDMSKKDFQLREDEDVTLRQLSITDIEDDGTLDTIGSTYERNSGMIRDSMDFEGPHVVTFSGILKYKTIPLAPLLTDILDIGRRSMGCPIEIEFAVNLPNLQHDQQQQPQQQPQQQQQELSTTRTKEDTRPTFAILQIRPIVITHEHCDISFDKENDIASVFMHSDRALGNGRLTGIQDVVYVPHDLFEPSGTIAMAREVGELNRRMVKEQRPYVLIGPGRWGTEDRWLGIPVAWGDISGARVIVETALESFNIEPSQGTHFFQNMISRKIGYISIPHKKGDSFIDWEWLRSQDEAEEGKYLRRVSLDTPLDVRLDGSCGGALVLKPHAPTSPLDSDPELEL